MPLFKYSLKIFIYIINQQNSEFLPLTTALVIKIRSFVDGKNSFLLGILIWIIIKATGLKYDIPIMSEYVNKSVKEYLEIEPIRSEILEITSFEQIFHGKISVFSKHLHSQCSFKQAIFDIETIMERKSDFKDLDEDDKQEDYLGMNNSDTEFSSVSSYDLQDRIIDAQDIKPEFVNDDYQKLLLNQEEQDKKFLDKIYNL